MKNNKATITLINSLKKLIKTFPRLRVRYEYDELANIHCVEVVPNEIYSYSDEYINWENQFIDWFIEKFPDQDVCVFSDDFSYGIQQVQLELVGKEFNGAISPN